MSVGFTVLRGQSGRPSSSSRSSAPIDRRRAQVGNEVLAHADGLAPGHRAPARSTLRFSQADVMATPLGRGPGRAHHRRRRRRCCCPTASTARCPRGCTPAWSGRSPATPEHLRHGAHHADQPLAPAPRPAGREPGRPDRPAGPHRQGGRAVRRLRPQRCRGPPPASEGAGPVVVVPRQARRQDQGDAGRHLARREEPRPGQAHRHGRRPSTRPATSPAVGHEPQAGRALQAAQGRRPCQGQQGGKLHGRSATWKAPGGRGRLRHHAATRSRCSATAAAPKVDTEVVDGRQARSSCFTLERGQLPLPGPRQERRRLGAVEQEDRPGPAPLTPPAPDSSAVSRVFPRSAAQTNRRLTAARGP